MARIVTQETDISVSDFIDSLRDSSKQVDSQRILEIITEVTNGRY